MKIIVFDMDGVLFDSIGNARKFFTQKHPGATPEIYNSLHSGNYHEEVLKYKHLKLEEPEEQYKKHRAAYSVQKSKTPLFEGVKEILADLHSKGFTLTINTNAYNRNCLPLLENSDVEKYFDFIATADITKDKVEKFKIIQDKYGVESQDVLFVTDALGDVLDAEQANVPTIAVTWGVHDGSYFEKEEHKNLIFIAETVNELEDFISTKF